MTATEPLLVYGEREAGKTILGLKLAMDACRGKLATPKIPVYIDLALVKAGATYLERATREFFRRCGLLPQIDINAHLQAGELFIIFDNFSEAQRDANAHARRIQMVSTFIKRFPKNKFLLLVNEPKARALQPKQKEDFGFDHLDYHILPLERDGIRRLTQQWLGPVGKYSTDLVNQIERRLVSSHLPRTPQVVTLVLWTLARENALCVRPVAA